MIEKTININFALKETEMRKRIPNNERELIYSEDPMSLNDIPFNEQKFEVGRFYCKLDVPISDSRSDGFKKLILIVGPYRKIYYSLCDYFNGSENIKNGDLVLFSKKGMDYRIRTIINLSNIPIIDSHKDIEEESAFKLEYIDEWINGYSKKLIRNIYIEKFTESEWTQINHSKACLILPERDENYFLSLKEQGNPILFKLESGKEFLKLPNDLRKLYLKQKYLIKRLESPVYDKFSFFDDVERIKFEIDEYVENINIEKLISSFKIEVESKYRNKIGGDDRLEGWYKVKCGINLDEYLTSFLPELPNYNSRGYCNLYSCDDWKEYKNETQNLEIKFKNSIIEKYNKNNHKSILLFETLSLPFFNRQRVLSQLNEVENVINKIKECINQWYPFQYIEKYPYFFTARKDLTDIIIAYNDQDSSKYNFIGKYY